MGKRDHHHRSENITITLEQLIPQDHLVRKIDAVIDVDFIYSAVENLYSENTGRPSVDPVLLIKMALLHMFSVSLPCDVPSKRLRLTWLIVDF